MRITLTILFVLLLAAYFYSYVDAGQKLSKREVYAVACRDYKENMPKKYKELSRREIWSTCTGEDKKGAPSYKEKEEKAKDWNRVDCIADGYLYNSMLDKCFDIEKDVEVIQ